MSVDTRAFTALSPRGFNREGVPTLKRDEVADTAFIQNTPRSEARNNSSREDTFRDPYRGILLLQGGHDLCSRQCQTFGHLVQNAKHSEATRGERSPRIVVRVRVPAQVGFQSVDHSRHSHGIESRRNEVGALDAGLLAYERSKRDLPRTIAIIQFAEIGEQWVGHPG